MNLGVLLYLIAEIRIHQLSEISIIVLIDRVKPNLISKLYRAGVNEVLTEPYGGESFVSAVTHHLDYRISKKRLKYEQSLSCQLKAMIDTSSIVSKTDPDGIITYVNDQFCAISGYTYDELVGQPHNIIRHPDNNPVIFQQLWETIRAKKTFRGIIMNRAKDGSNYYVDTTISPVLDDSDTIMEYISIRHDVTQLIKKQQGIEEQRRQIQNVLDAQTSLICLVDKERGVMQANHGFLKFLGIPNLDFEPIGIKCLSDLFLDIDYSLQIKEGDKYIWMDQLNERQGEFVKVAMKDRFYNHHIFSIHVHKIPDHRFTNDTCYLVTFDNVTELSRALRDAKAASEAESRFLATMSHEIRTPLNGILGFTELLSESSLDEDQRRYLQAITHSGETLRQIINDILEVMKFDREALTLYTETITVIGELEAMIYPFYAQAAKKNIDLLVYIDPRLPLTIEADLLRLKQMITNLIANALKFTPSGKKVHVRIKKLAASNGNITIGFSVADEGIGIEPDHKAEIFKAFVQADSSIARKYGGTGLGLNIVLRIIQAFGGKIRLKSTVGKGSVFHTEITFSSELIPHDYRCQHHVAYLYLRDHAVSARFHLVERYLKGFRCCHQCAVRINNVETIDDTTEVTLFAFAETMTASEIVALSNRFEHARLIIVPSLSPLPFIPPTKDQTQWLSSELSWSSLTHALEIYDAPQASASDIPHSSTFQGLRILVAEDNEVNQFYIQELLNKLGIQNDLAADGYEAVKKYMSGHYDLILMDINMPNQDGIVSTQQIRNYEHSVHASPTPIIGLSADAVESNITRYLQEGLDGYLIKPLRKSELITLIKSYFASREVEGEPEAIPPTPQPSESSLLQTVSTTLELPEEIIGKLFEKFIHNAQQLLEQLQTSENDTAKLKMIIHSLKGISKNLYLEPLGTLCADFETEIPTFTSDARTKALNRLRQEVGTTIHLMQKELATQ